jgi:hypothetical protein
MKEKRNKGRECQGREIKGKKNYSRFFDSL